MLRKNKGGLLLFACIFFLWPLHTPLHVLGQQEPAQTFLSQESLSRAAAGYADNDLFSSEEPLRFKLILDYKALLKDRGDEREYHAASVVYKDESGESVTINLKVRVRGKHRRDPNVCIFPPLRLNFPKKKVQGTVFAGADKLKLVTHCIGEKFVIREYLVYKVYNLLTPMSYRVRLCRVIYEDLQGKRKTDSSYAFLIEDDAQLAERNQVTIMSDELLIRMEATHNGAMAKLALFQFMIGNTDWSVPYRHNIKLMYQESELKPVPVPYDFDYTGIVMPPYAKPPPEIGITSVRQRLFRGYTFPDEIYAELVPFFNSRQKPIYQLYQQSDLLDTKYRKQTLRFLDDFYAIINNPKKFNKQIVQTGKKNERKSVVVKGLE